MKTMTIKTMMKTNAFYCIEFCLVELFWAEGDNLTTVRGAFYEPGIEQCNIVPEPRLS
jgi:hypothetical protein